MKGPSRTLVARLSIVVAMVASALSCSSGNSGNQSRPFAQPADVAEPEFTAATAKQVDHIAYFLDDGWAPPTGPALLHAHTVASDITEGGYFVAAELATARGFAAVWWHAGTPRRANEDPASGRTRGMTPFEKGRSAGFERA